MSILVVIWDKDMISTQRIWGLRQTHSVQFHRPLHVQDRADPMRAAWHVQKTCVFAAGHNLITAKKWLRFFWRKAPETFETKYG